MTKKIPIANREESGEFVIESDGNMDAQIDALRLHIQGITEAAILKIREDLLYGLRGRKIEVSTVVTERRFPSFPAHIQSEALQMLGANAAGSTLAVLSALLERENEFLSVKELYERTGFSDIRIPAAYLIRHFRAPSPSIIENEKGKGYRLRRINYASGNTNVLPQSGTTSVPNKLS